MRCNRSFDNSRIPIPKKAGVRGIGYFTTETPFFIYCTYLIVTAATLGAGNESGYWFGFPCVSEQVRHIERQRLIIALIAQAMGGRRSKNTPPTPQIIAALSVENEPHGTTVAKEYDQSKKRSCA